MDPGTTVVPIAIVYRSRGLDRHNWRVGRCSLGALYCDRSAESVIDRENKAWAHASQMLADQIALSKKMAFLAVDDTLRFTWAPLPEDTLITIMDTNADHGMLDVADTRTGILRHSFPSSCPAKPGLVKVNTSFAARGKFGVDTSAACTWIC